MGNCSQCDVPLVPAETAAGAASACPRCEHVWLAPGQLAEFQQTITRRYTPDDVRALHEEARARRQAALKRPVVYCSCPECGNQVLRRTFGELSFLLLHVCVAHGIWVEHGELEGIVDYVARGGEIIEMRGRLEQLEQRARKAETRSRELENAAQHAGGFIPLVIPF